MMIEPLRVPVLAVEGNFECSKCKEKNAVAITVFHSKEEIIQAIAKLQEALKLFQNANN